MNWKEIKEKYPKSYESFYLHYLGRLQNWAKLESRVAVIKEFESIYINQMKDRILYDFFDEQGINCFVILGWGYEIMVTEEENEYSLYDNKPDEWYSSRTEAEEQAFLRAFKILEERLCGQE